MVWIADACAIVRGCASPVEKQNDFGGSGSGLPILVQNVTLFRYEQLSRKGSDSVLSDGGGNAVRGLDWNSFRVKSPPLLGNLDIEV